MASKYVSQNGGALKEVEGLTVSAGVGDAGKIVALGADGKLDPTVMAEGVAADSQAFEASEALSAGDLINIWNDAGTAKVRKASAASPGKPAVGFVKAGVAGGGTATVFFSRIITGLAGMTPGAEQFLSETTPGTATEVPPSGSGEIIQRLGVAAAANLLKFEPAQPIELA